jgi:hypothetical protein
MKPHRPGEEHHRTGSRDDGQALIAAEVDGLLADGSATGAAVHPHVADTGGGAGAHDGFGGGGRRHQERALDGRVDVLDAGVARAAFDFAGMGMHGNGIEAAGAEFAEDGAGKVVRLAGDTDEGEAFVGEELLDVGGEWHFRSGTS